MREFIHKLVSFLLPLLIVSIALEFLIRNIPNDYSYKKKFLDENSKNIEVLFLGSSHAYYGINPNFISLNAFNASHISQSLDYDYEIIRKYQDDWIHLKYIVVPIDYFTLFSRLSNSIEFWRVKNYEIYYDINKSNRPADQSEILSVKLFLNLQRVYAYYFQNRNSITCSELGYGKDQRKIKDLSETGKAAAKRHTTADRVFFEENRGIINSVVEFASKNDIKIIFYTTPAYHTYVSNLNLDQLELTVKTINDFVLKNPNCIYYNLLKDTEFTSDDFIDADHLNDKGAKKLSIKLETVIGNE